MNLTDFDEETIKEIHATVDIFQNITFAKDAKDWKWMKIHGCVLGKPELDYYVLPLNKGDYHVQVGKAGFVIDYKFGIAFASDSEPLPYHNPMD
jgi:hypothetical protein